ncbi:MAG: glycerol-3-phosphate dehydrogenase, partial [Gammaproteobacteria bacterium]|nr:glycerol-3-phosphate dehydrogenase [Gammaproteobacteria bacterium]
MAVNQARYDLAVIGAGINGAGIARDAAMRGLRVIILDKHDMCSGTSAISSRLIHGGLRYLEYAEIALVFESLRERRCLLRIAGHLVKPLRISIPIFRGARRGPLMIRLGMIAYDLLSFSKRLPRHDMFNSDEICAAEPGLRRDGLRGAARYFDAQVAFAERLVLENLLAARFAGAEIKTYAEVREIRTRDGRVDAISYRDKDGVDHEIGIDTVVNASGPWVDEVLKAATSSSQRLVGGTKGSHIIVSHFEGAPSDAFYVEAEADGRPFFIIPWNGQYLIGTTDIRYDDSLESIRASRAEVDYLIAETNRVFPDARLSIADINYTYSGVRSLPFQEKGPESAITRRHVIKRNRKIAQGLISIIGGKLTTYRNLAEQTVDLLAKILRRKLPPCRTADTLLPGACGADEAREKIRASGMLTEKGGARLLSIYGGRAGAMIDLAIAEPKLAKTIDADGHYLAAEVAYVIREEFARTLQDIVFRRMMTGFDADQGRSLYDAIATVAAAELEWSQAELQAELGAL